MYQPVRGLGDSSIIPTTAIASALSPVTALPNALAAVQSAISSIFQGSDPVKDKQRQARIDSYFAGAMQGSKSAEAELRCYAGTTDPTWLALAPNKDSSGGCGNAAGSTPSRNYAKAKVLELEARRAAGQIGTGLIGVSDLPSQVVGFFANPYVLGLGAVVLYLVFRPRRRRNPPRGHRRRRHRARR